MAHARARVVFEFDQHLFLVGCTRIGLAMRSLNSREVSLLQPFRSVAAAERMCRALARAQIVAFADEEAARVNGPGKRRRRASRRRRRVPRMPVELASMSAARPPASLRPSVEVAPSAPSRPMSRRASLADRRPDPATVAELDTVIDRLETTSG
jgi:hypothetical protein